MHLLNCESMIVANTRFKKWIIIVLIFVVMISCLQLFELFYPCLFSHINKDCVYSEPVDIVYTWVNGSDPKFIEAINKYLNINSNNKTDANRQRFDDKYELKFSLRSLEKYAPWFRNVYIVTNGQIPYWLNLDYEKVFLVSHEDIFVNKSDLPTFSSPAIESHLHRIPGISKRFIYFNDDILIGARLYLDDFFNENKGYQVYMSWPLPMCAPDCPWMYVSDGQCDQPCHNDECQMDGGDCEIEVEHEDGLIADYSKEIIETDFREFENNSYQNQNESQSIFNISYIPNSFKTADNNTKIITPTEIKTDRHDFLNNYNKSNLSKLLNLTDFIKEHNSNIIKLNKLKRKRSVKQRASTSNSSLIEKLRKPHFDAYGASLQHTNRIYNIMYGFMPRQVPAHAPIMIDREIMEELQIKLAKQFEITSGNKFRRANDIQFAFSYYYYVVHESLERSVEDIFDGFDTDESNTWSDREIRTILTQLYDLPLTFTVVDHFEYLLNNCSAHIQSPAVSTPEYERYVDSKLPVISKDMVVNCPVLSRILREHFGKVPRFKHRVIRNSENNYVTFKMLNSNVSDVVGHLDEIRKTRKKFICLNDNLDELKTSENELVKAILYDFYLSLFPKPSKFELPAEYRNRFLYIDELRNWKSYHFKIKLCTYFFIIILCYITFFNICRRRYLCNIINKLFCFI